jgi:hypothetical protein
MTAPIERLDGDAPDPKVARVLARYFEAVAQVAEAACLELYDLGINHRDATAYLLGRRPPHRAVVR